MRDDALITLIFLVLVKYSCTNSSLFCIISLMRACLSMPIGLERRKTSFFIEFQIFSRFQFVSVFVLGCQIILTKEMEGMVLTLPKVTRNFYVDGHVPKPHWQIHRSKLPPCTSDKKIFDPVFYQCYLNDRNTIFLSGCHTVCSVISNSNFA